VLYVDGWVPPDTIETTALNNIVVPSSTTATATLTPPVTYQSGSITLKFRNPDGQVSGGVSLAVAPAPAVGVTCIGRRSGLTNLTENNVKVVLRLPTFGNALTLQSQSVYAYNLCSWGNPECPLLNGTPSTPTMSFVSIANPTWGVQATVSDLAWVSSNLLIGPSTVVSVNAGAARDAVRFYCFGDAPLADITNIGGSR
jgi:hypothetical protein